MAKLPTTKRPRRLFTAPDARKPPLTQQYTVPMSRFVSDFVADLWYVVRYMLSTFKMDTILLLLSKALFLVAVFAMSIGMGLFLSNLVGLIVFSALLNSYTPNVFSIASVLGGIAGGVFGLIQVYHWHKEIFPKSR